LNEAKNCVVLGRFQPFHKGHEQLVLAAHTFAKTDGLGLVIAIGSAQCGYEPMNPWTIEEREEMIRKWMNENNIEATVVTIEDINDAPRWVEHAEKSHGKGTLYSSDEPTLTLYERAGWNVKHAEYAQRDAFEGWRVRQTMRMLSTVDDAEAIQMVLEEVLPKTIAAWMIENDALFRLSTFETGVHAG
jgi:nicotinamide-nucleotide adenylyltransferase